MSDDRAGRLAPLVYSAKTFAAGMLALGIGFAAGLPRPYWALITVYVVSQPLAGEMLSKAAYRVVGTVLGAAVAAALVPALAGAPVLLALAIAGWIALCLYLSLLHRTARAYLFNLAGYTAAIVGFPSALHPAAILGVAGSRVVEIVLGVLCATLVHSLVLPRSMGSVLRARIDRWLADAERMTLDALEGLDRATSAADRRRLATDAAELHLMATQLPYDTSSLRARQRGVRALEDRMVLLIPTVAAVADRVATLGPQAGEGAARREEARRRFAAWLRGDPGADEGRVREAIAALARGAGPGWTGMLTRSLAARLADLLDIHGDCRALREYLRAGDEALPARLDPVVRERARRPLHRDPALAAWTALAAALGTALAAGVWLATGWTDGPTATVFAAIGCCIFATRDDPVPALASFLVWSIAALPLAALYMFVVLPAVHGFPMLVLALAPALLALGTLYALPRHASKASPLVFGFLGTTHLQPRWSADLAGFLHGAGAMLGGLGLAIVVMRVMRTMSVERSARRIARLAWGELAAVAAAEAPPERAPLLGRMLDRLALLTPRLAAAGPSEELARAAVLDDLRLTINVAKLQEARAGLGGDARAATGRLLERLAHHFESLAAGAPHAPPAAVLGALDDALRAVADDDASTTSEDAVLALVGLRRRLFPAEGAPRAAAQ